MFSKFGLYLLQASERGEPFAYCSIQQFKISKKVLNKNWTTNGTMMTGYRILFTRNINEFNESRMVVPLRCYVSYR
jgi:hypothetical protein